MLVSVMLVLFCVLLDAGSGVEVSGVHAWVEAGTVGHFLNLTPVSRSATLSVQINVLLVGFQGDGNRQLDIPQEQLAHFFEHLADRLEHVVVPIGEEQTTLKKIITRETGLEHDASIRFIMADPLVTVALENILLQNARRDKDNTEYVDVFRVTALFHHLLEHLHLANSSYTLALLNPKPPNAGKRYGYRAGLAKWELDELAADAGWRSKLEILLSHRKAHEEVVQRPLAPIQNDLKNDGVGKLWAQWFLKYASDTAGDCRSAMDRSTSSTAGCLAKWKVADLSLHALTRHMAMEGSRYHLRYLQAMLRDELPFDCLVDSWISHERFAFLDLSAGPFEWSPIGSAAVGVRNLLTVPRHSFSVKAEAAETSKEELEFAKLKKDYQLLCLSDDEPDSICPNVLKILQDFDHKIHKDQIREITDASLSDAWLAELSAITARAIRHLLVPGTALFATPFADRVQVSLFIMQTHTDYNPRGPEYFNFEEFSAELQRLASPGQKILLSVKKMAPAAERTVLLAFQESIKNSVIPSVDVESGSFVPSKYTYVDSVALRNRIEEVLPIAHAEAHNVVALADRHVTIFLFSTNYPYPILVDKWMQAKALNDVVIATQSNFPSAPSRVQCNGEAIMVDLRDPAREMLSAAALTIAGIVPPHVSYSKEMSCVTQEWLWSVGDSPLSHTSHGLHFGRLHIDLAARNYVLWGLEQSRLVARNVTDRLFEARTFRENFSVMYNASSVAAALREVSSLWDQILNHMGRLHFGAALKLLHPLQGNMSVLMTLTDETLRKIESLRCVATLERMRKEHRGSATSWRIVLFGAVALNGVALTLWAILHKRKGNKVKIN